MLGMAVMVYVMRSGCADTVAAAVMDWADVSTLFICISVKNYVFNSALFKGHYSTVYLLVCFLQYRNGGNSACIQHVCTLFEFISERFVHSCKMSKQISK